MLGHLGFSYVGLIYLLMLFIPNIIWSNNQPVGSNDIKENKILLLFERVGQVFCTCSVLIFSDFNIKQLSIWSLWLIVSFLLMVLYEICWIRYFHNKHTEENFYSSFFHIPIPLASLSVTAFLLLGIYGKVIFLIISTIILGIGHMGIHIQHLKGIKEL
ncbi:hypothetical protein CDLVIII_2658 [Clostridium sp. DL-VIII]|uniref:hypothetical protein n=1 Tax=Clostridium sp. DL-VIII TaxID=641107 RepID=UPI00023B01FC|nr:hypothetical protein [Clostridium sp. DL-VIII]EHI99260.1 hypothetical protein CDLVIII_2658 [Clostridium sp. DL-VIII]